jgi:serine/threonine protein kinase/Tfp pilus assembly protein PilF
MIRVIRICRKCGARIFSDAPEGLCARCVLKTALTVSPDATVAAGDSSAEAAYSAEAAAKAGSAKADDPGQVNKSAREATKTASAAELLGELGDYELLEEIGRGGQGVVFRARQKSLNRTVALKVISLGQWASKAHLKRFRLEAEAAARLEHPGIVPIYEVGERGGSCYFSMKFVEGGQLDEVLKREPMSSRRAAELFVKIARTVQFAHEHGILHRDIKPGNILLDKHGEPYLTDFGLARLIEQESTVTNSFDVFGTPSYMPPEQAAGQAKELTPAADVYSLGAVFYQMLTGERPFAGSTTYETIRLVLENEPRNPRLRNPKVDVDLATICLKCLEKDPSRRYAAAGALADDVERWLRHQPITARRAGAFIRGKKWVRRNPSIAVMAALLLAVAAPLGVMIWKGESQRSRASNPAVPEKSIAVLPFSNLSKEQENTFFAVGVQDEIMSNLARIADLKVISRTSANLYKSGNPRNSREIGQQLGVAHLLEGNVQRIGNRLRVNAQLIRADSDTHVWAQTYDRDVSDLFAIQSEIAQTIAGQLYAKISPAEKLAIEEKPTTDLVAFDLYTRAKSLGIIPEGNLFLAADLLNQAVARDPTFFQAYCELAYVHDELYHLHVDRTPARLALAEAAVEAAFRLRPDAGEAHLARAGHFYRGYLDYDGALKELEIARQTLPNDARLFELKGYIERRRPDGNPEEALRNLERAIDLDPRNFLVLQQTALSYFFLGRYADQAAVLDRMLAIRPDDVEEKVTRAFVDLYWKADTRPLHQLMDEIRAKDHGAIQTVAAGWLECALAERDPAAAAEALAAMGENTLGNTIPRYSPRFVQGLIARMTKDDAKARDAFTAARAEQERLVRADPDDAGGLCVLGVIDAALGRKEEALREGWRAVELLPVEKDVTNGTRVTGVLAIIAAWVGDNDLACQQLAVVVQRRNEITYGELKLLPFWDPLRGDPRFEKIVASLAPKENGK